MAQAKVGGEIGLNGEFYQGGEFLPSSPNTIKGEFTHQQIKAQKFQVSQDKKVIDQAINEVLLDWYKDNSKVQDFPQYAVTHAREAFAMYLRDNGVNIRNINIHSTDLAKWVL